MVTGIEATLAERGARYGSFRTHAFLAQGIKALFVAGPSWGRMASDQRQALEVIADKIARILNGDPDYDDNWRDIAGYATLVLNRLVEETGPTNREGRNDKRNTE